MTFLSLVLFIKAKFRRLRRKVKFELLRSAPWKAIIDWIMVNEFEPLLLIRQTGGLTRVCQQLYMRARIPVQWQNNYDVYQNESTSHRTGIRPEKHLKPSARELSHLEEVWSKRSNPKPCLWSSPRPKRTIHRLGSQCRPIQRSDPGRHKPWDQSRYPA